MAYIKTIEENKGNGKIRTVDQFRRYKIYITKESKLFARPGITGERFELYQENSRLSTINCSLQDTCKQFEAVKKFFSFYYKKINHTDKVLLFAVDILQSFAPRDDISLEEANEIARLTVSEVYGSHLQGIIATHTDRPHIHNHILLNSIDLRGDFVQDDIVWISKLQMVSDRLCAERGYDVFARGGIY